MSKTGETIVKEYLENRGLVVRKIPEGDTKTADFAVYTNDELAFYLEEKTLELTPVRWRNIDPVYNAIAKHVREALKQFNCLNPDKRFPNVLAITSMDPGKNVNHLFSVLTGHVITASGKISWIEKMKSVQEELALIDLYLWFDSSQLAGHIWEGENLEHQQLLAVMLGLFD